MSEHDHDPGMCFRPPGEGICPGCRADAERDTIARVVAFLRRAACVYDGAPRAVLEANASLIEEGHWRNDDDCKMFPGVPCGCTMASPGHWCAGSLARHKATMSDDMEARAWIRVAYIRNVHESYVRRTDREVQHLANEYRAVAAEEREACARECDAIRPLDIGGECARRIRARGAR